MKTLPEKKSAKKAKPIAKAKAVKKATKRTYRKPGQGALVKPKQVKKNPGKPGRRTLVLPVDQAEQWGFLQATHDDMAAMMGIARDRISREFNTEPPSEFVTLYEKGKAKSRLGLRKKMFNKAMDMDQPSISIFTCKNILGWTDRIDQHQNATVRVVMEEPDKVPRYLQDLTEDTAARN